MNFNRVLLGLSFGVAFCALADGALTDKHATKNAALPNVVVQAPDCGVTSNDPFERPVLYTQGKYKGQCGDTSKRRSVELLQENELKQIERAAENDSYQVANFYHDGKFWIANIPKGGIQDVIYMFEQWPSMGGHGQLRFRMRCGKKITLTPQPPSSEKGIVELDGLVSSAEALLPKGATYSVMAGIDSWGAQSSYHLVHRLMSVGTSATKAQNSNGNIVRTKQWKMRFSTKEAEDILFNALKRADRDKETTYYDTQSKNCVTESFTPMGATGPTTLNYKTLAAIKSFMENNPKPLIEEYRRLREDFPKELEESLRAQNLMDSSAAGPLLPDLSDEVKAAEAVGRTIDGASKGCSQ